MALELEFDGEEAKLYQNDSLMLSGNVGQAAATGLSGLVGAQNKTLADNFWMISGLNDEREHNAVNELVSRNGRALEYDGDGNLTKDDEGRIYAWDIFSRLISVTTAEARVEFSYDALGRRMSKSVDLDNDGSVERETAYIYSGWNCVEERAAANGAQAETAYVWAEDLSGSMQGAGGVGGLLAVIDGAGAHTAASDANGNVAAYFDGSGNIAAEYDYTPFGTVLSKSGAKADGFAYRFSTKPYDAETGLYYYGYRYYSPELGRWISQDPIEEAGGLNLYGFVSNNSINFIDSNGKIPLDTIWDIGNIIYDIAVGDDVSLAADVAALAVPYLPAGSTKLVKIAKVGDVLGICKNAKNIKVSYKYVGNADGFFKHTLPAGAKDWVEKTATGSKYSKFIPGWGDKEIKELIEAALKEAKDQGKIKPNEIDNYIFDAKRIIGASNGKKVKKIRIHVNSDGTNLHAFPVE
jgi:RHS repeat-associated protein